MAQPAKDAEGNHRPSIDLGRQIPQNKWRSAQTAQLLAQCLLGQWMLARFGGRLIRNTIADNAGFRRSVDRERLADGGVYSQINGGSSLRIRRTERFSQTGHQLRIVVLPDSHAGLDDGEINRPMSE